MFDVLKQNRGRREEGKEGGREGEGKDGGGGEERGLFKEEANYQQACLWISLLHLHNGSTCQKS